jgi:hypothetical protein
MPGHPKLRLAETVSDTPTRVRKLVNLGNVVAQGLTQKNIGVAGPHEPMPATDRIKSDGVKI